MTLYNEVNNNNKIVIDNTLKTNAIVRVWDAKNVCYILHISNYVAAVYNSLLQKLQANNWKEISITMKKTGNILTIIPVGQNTVTSLNNAEYFLVENNGVTEESSESLTEIASFIANYDNILEYNNQLKKDLETFRQEHFHGHSASEYEDGFKTLTDLEETKKSMGLKGYNKDAVITTYARKTNKSKEEIETAIQFYTNVERYADSYKELYGHKPKFAEIFK